MTETEPQRDMIDGAFSHPAFVACRRAGAAAILLGGSPLRVLWANVAAAGLFEAADAGELAARLLRSDRGSLRRLERLALDLTPGEAPRLERLRFAWGFAPRSLTLLCARPIEIDGGPMLALAAASPGYDTDLWYVEAEARRPVRRPGEAVASGQLAPAELGASDGDDPVASTRRALREAAGGTEQVRFVWRTDSAGRVVDIDRTLLGRLGLLWPAQGFDIAASVTPVDPTGAGALTRAIDRQITWTGVEVDAPLEAPATAPGVGLRLPLSLSGSPVFEPGGRFAGYRGFGRIDLQRLFRTEEAISAPSAAATSEPGRDLDHSASGSADEEISMPTVGEASSATAPASAVLTEPHPAVETPPRTATVLHLRPPSSRGPSGRAADLQGAADGPADGDQNLSESERINFQEIGRTLTAAIGAVTSSGIGGDAVPSPEPPAARSGGDPMANAALLVERTAAGLLVTQHPKVVFANDALLTELRYDSHAALANALGLYFAGLAAPAAAEAEAALALPDAFGELRRFASVARAIAWDGEPAMLSTLRPVEAAHHGAAAEGSALPLPAMLDSLDVAAAGIDAHGRVLSLNRQAAEWFGPGEPKDRVLSAIMAPESQVGFATRLSDFRSDARSDLRTSADHVARMADGTMVPIGLTLVRIGPERLSAVWRDLSAEREAEWELSRLKSQSERVSEQQPGFLAKVSHEIRTPLNAILGFAEIMIDERFGPLGSTRYKDYLRDIHASGEHVMKLIGDLLDLSRIETGKLDLDLGPVDVNRIIADCVAQGQAEAHRQRVIVRTSLASRLPMAMADERSARQMVTNILANAVKFNEPGGQVIVSSTVNETGAAVIVRLRDTGVGMSDAQIATALEPFRQLAPANSQGGTGLGLPLTRALALANGASLSIRSQPGHGTLVEVSFQSSGRPAARVPA